MNLHAVSFLNTGLSPISRLVPAGLLVTGDLILLDHFYFFFTLKIRPGHERSSLVF